MVGSKSKKTSIENLMSSIPIQPSKNDSIPLFQQYQHQFVDYLRDPDKHENIPQFLPERSTVYAKLLYSKIEGSLDTCFPICSQLLEANRWQQLIQTFIKNHQCQSPLYREIPDEFVDFLMNEQDELVLPKFIIELAHYEWMELVLETEKTSHSTAITTIQEDLLNNIPILNPILHLLHYHYPVQNITDSNPYWKNWSIRKEQYPEDPIILAGLRDSEDSVHFIQLNAVTTRLIELLQEGKSTGEKVLLKLASEMEYDNQESILSFGSEILQKFKDQQILVGVKHY